MSVNSINLVPANAAYQSHLKQKRNAAIGMFTSGMLATSALGLMDSSKCSFVTKNPKLSFALAILSGVATLFGLTKSIALQSKINLLDKNV